MNEYEATIAAFKDVARRYCSEIEQAAQSSDIGLLRRLNALLPELYWRAQALPDIDAWATESDEENEERDGNAVEISSQEHLAWHTEASSALQKVLASHDAHRYVFDPFTNDDANEALLSFDLADIYVDLKTQLRLDEINVQQSDAERLWHWKWSFRMHWGQHHLVPALSAIGWLVYRYWDEYDEEWEDREVDPIPPDTP